LCDRMMLVKREVISMKILITGGCGYLGTVTAIELAEAGHEVTCFDIRQKPLLCCHETVQAGQKHFVKGNVCSRGEVKTYAEKSDAIVHLAFIVGGPGCSKNPEWAKTLAVEGTANVIAAGKGRILLFASSDAVYGNQAPEICGEEAACEPVSLYGTLKLACEQELERIERSIILRLPSHFGVSPSMRMDLLVHSLAQEMFRCGTVKLFQADIVRALIHVRDAASAIRFVLEHHDSTAGKVFNVASGAWSKREIAGSIADIYSGSVVEDAARSDQDRRDFRLDCRRINALGWQPGFSLERGLMELKTFLDSMLKS